MYQAIENSIDHYQLPKPGLFKKGYIDRHSLTHYNKKKKVSGAWFHVKACFTLNKNLFYYLFSFDTPCICAKRIVNQIMICFNCRPLPLPIFQFSIKLITIFIKEYQADMARLILFSWYPNPIPICIKEYQANTDTDF